MSGRGKEGENEGWERGVVWIVIMCALKKGGRRVGERGMDSDNVCALKAEGREGESNSAGVGQCVQIYIRYNYYYYSTVDVYMCIYNYNNVYMYTYMNKAKYQQSKMEGYTWYRL